MITAAEPSDEIRQRAIDHLQTLLGRTIELRSRIDPAILGGVVLRVGDTVYDASLRNQLQRVRSAALQRVQGQIRDTLDRFVHES